MLKLRHLSYPLFVNAAISALLLLTVMYWFIFLNEMPPFIQGRPRFDVTFTLGLNAGVSAAIGGIIQSETR